MEEFHCIFKSIACSRIDLFLPSRPRHAQSLIGALCYIEVDLVEASASMKLVFCLVYNQSCLSVFISLDKGSFLGGRICNMCMTGL